MDYLTLAKNIFDITMGIVLYGLAVAAAVQVYDIFSMKNEDLEDFEDGEEIEE